MEARVILVRLGNGEQGGLAVRSRRSETPVGTPFASNPFGTEISG
jgi:hypothetical protein